MLSFEEAQAHVLALAAPLGAETVPLDRALGRVLVSRVETTRPLPSFDASSMDGYALATRDLASAPRDEVGRIVLVRRGESRAGHAPEALTPGTTMRIFTGAPLPDGADAVIMQENVMAEGDRVHLAADAPLPTPRAFVRAAGADVGEGVVALESGAVLGGAQIALLAALGVTHVNVHRAPRITIAPTGDEVFALGADTPRFGVTDTLGPALAVMGRRDGFLTTTSPPLRDDRALLEERFEELLAHSDVLVTIGGVSVGDHDLVRPALERMGVEFRFIKVAIRPGKPIAVGVKGDKLVFGLPGNPASALVTYALFARPALLCLLGRTQTAATPRPHSVRLAARITHEPGRRSFFRARIENGIAEVPPQQASGSIVSMSRANALVTMPADRAELEAGAPIEAFSYEELGLD